MPTVGELLSAKNAEVYTVHPEVTVLEATRLMNQHKIGSLVVLEDGRVVGMFTERDVLTRVVSQELPPAAVRVKQVMTHQVHTCRAGDDIDEVSRTMRDHHIRHVPVVDKSGALVGLISIGDLNAFHASRQEAHINFLNEYVYGRA
jgi:CBS domain-containing protein